MIELVNVSAGYGKKAILHQVNLKVEPGKITVLVGPNGCGKSTLLKTLVRILPRTAGEILIDGASIEEFPSTDLAKRVAYLPQNKRTPDISVLRLVLHGRFPYLNYPRRYGKEDMRIAKEALRWAGLEELAEEPMSRLSGGMQQKVYLAMALAQSADTLLLDEPTTYLDVAHQLKLMEMVRSLAGEGKAVLMVLHDLSQALHMADEVIVMESGCIVQKGTAEEVYKDGTLQKVFGVDIEQVQTKNGCRYLAEMKKF